MSKEYIAELLNRYHTAFFTVATIFLFALLMIGASYASAEDEDKEKVIKWFYFVIRFLKFIVIMAFVSFWLPSGEVFLKM